MKVAVCYSGMVRGFLNNIGNHNKFFLSKYDCDVYLSFWDVYGYGYVPFSRYKSDKHIRFNLEQSKCEIIPITESDLMSAEHKQQIIETINPKQYVFDSFKDYEPILNDREKILRDMYGYNEENCSLGQLLTWNTLSGYYRIFKCGEMVKNSGVNYDVVVKMKPDSILQSDVELQTPEDGIIYVNSKQSWSDDTVDDTLLYGNMQVMDLHSKMHNEIIDIYIATGGPGNAAEHLLYLYLNNNKIKINRALSVSTHYYPWYRQKDLSENQQQSDWFKDLK